MKNRIELKVDSLNRVLEIDPDSGLTITVEWAYGRPRLYTKDGSVEMSARLSHLEMELYLEGILVGIGLAESANKRQDK